MDKATEKKLRQQIECIWGTCSHAYGSRACVFEKVVDLPPEKQVDFIIRTIKKTCYTRGTKAENKTETKKRPSPKQFNS